MQTLVLALIATDFLLIIALIIAMATIRKIRRSSSDGEGEKLMALESKLRIYFENLERDGNEFRKEVASYLEKNMESSLSTTRNLYSQSESQSRSLNASISSMNERLSSSLMDLKLASKGEMEAFSKSLQGEFEKIRAENEKSITNISEQTKTLVSLVRADMEKIRSDNEKKLEEMRRTVDEKLQSTLETRLTESFKLVSNNLDQLRSALGEINKLSRDGIFNCLISCLDKSFLPGRLRVQFVGEIDVQRMTDDFNRRFLAKSKTTLHIVLSHIAVLLRGGLTQGKLAEFVTANSKTIVAEILGRLDIILIRIGPIQFHLLALVGYGIDVLLVTALGDEIASVVVAAEEDGEM